MFRSGKNVIVFLLFVGTSLGSLAQGGPERTRILQPVERNLYAVIPGSAHPQAKPESDAGRVSGNMKINGVSLVFGLSPDQQVALHALLQEQQDRSSPNYHKWLTPEQYADRFGMNQTDVAKVTSWLQSEGFEINVISRSRTRIAFSGTVSQVEAAFRTEMHHYLVNGELHFANATDLSVPAALAGTFLSIGNLNDFLSKPVRSTSSNSSLTLTPHYTDSTSGSNYIAPADFVTIYDLAPLYTAGYDGSGQTIAVMGQTAIYTFDLDAFRSAAGLPARTSANFQQTTVPNSGDTTVVNANALPEAELALEWTQAVAPNASINYVYVGNATNFTAFNALQYAIDNNLAPVIAITYGTCEPLLGATEAKALQQEAQQANTQGQTIVAASGDAGAADCDGGVASATQGFAVDVPASIPEVTGVGGTEFNDIGTTTPYWNTTNTATGGSAISYIPEIAWDDSELVGLLNATGGGASTFFPKPAWQLGAGVPADNARDVPDVSLSASAAHDPYLICASPNYPAGRSCTAGFTDSNGNLTHSGGTSFGAPAFAGIVALINQRTKTSQGNVNPTLYTLAESTPTAFHDINSGSNIVPCTTGTPNCPTTGIQGFGFLAGTGYDQTTGLGSIDASVLVNAWPVDYSFSINPVPISISGPGAQATATLLLNPAGSFTGTVALTCTPQSGVAGLTCTLSPTSVTASSPSATLTVLTVGANSSSLVKPASHMGFLMAGATLFAGIFLIDAPLFRRRRIGLRSLLLLVFLAAGLGCGGSTSSTKQPPPPPPTPTPAGLYTVKITGTSGSTSFSTTVTVGVL